MRIISAHLKGNSLRDLLFMQNTLMHTHTTAFYIAGSVAVKCGLLKSWSTDLMVWLGEKGMGVNKASGVV